MKNVAFKKIGLLLFSSIVIFLSSCSKEKKIENRLTKDGGKWNINSVSYNIVNQTTSGQELKSGTATNCGTFTFNESGKGTFSYTVENELREGEFSWSVSDEDVTIAKTTQTIDLSSGGFNQSITAYVGTMGDKTSLSLSGTETNQYASGNFSQSVFTGDFELSK